MTPHTSKIIWTQIDEAPALATYSFLPILQAFVKGTGLEVETRDISLAGRILANFPDDLQPEQRVPDQLAHLGALTKQPDANIIKLPNISASLPQLKQAIAELRAHGYDVPEYPESPKDDAEKAVQARYARCLGSAVNPVLREGNSDRRSPPAVKAFSRKHPHKLGPWKPESKAHVAHMSEGDWFGNETSLTLAEATDYRIEFVDAAGKTTVLKPKASLLAGEIIDASKMSVKALRKFYADQIDDAKAKGLLLSLHLKATMMKVSDPIMFGHAVSVFFADVFEKHAAALKQAGVNPNLGLGDLYEKIQALPADQRAAIEADIQAVYAKRPALAMVDSDKGITNLHVPNDVIVDASMPVVVRDSGIDVGTRRQAARDQGDDPGPLLRRHLPDDLRRLPQERRFRSGHAWAAFRTSASWRSKPRSTARTTRRSSRRPLAASAWSTTPPARRCSSRRSRRATSSACVRPRTSRSATG